jgi:hypothetical protein
MKVSDCLSGLRDGERSDGIRGANDGGGAWLRQVGKCGRREIAKLDILVAKAGCRARVF